jgi:hypothetical protein
VSEARRKEREAAAAGERKGSGRRVGIFVGAGTLRPWWAGPTRRRAHSVLLVVWAGRWVQPCRDGAPSRGDESLLFPRSGSRSNPSRRLLLDRVACSGDIGKRSPSTGEGRYASVSSSLGRLRIGHSAANVNGRRFLNGGGTTSANPRHDLKTLQFMSVRTIGRCKKHRALLTAGCNLCYTIRYCNTYTSRKWSSLLCFGVKCFLLFTRETLDIITRIV